MEDNKIERLKFGQHNLIAYELSNWTFRHFPVYQLDKQQKCLIDNIWIAHNKKDTKTYNCSIKCLRILLFYKK